jgi:hypothetical protein
MNPIGFFATTPLPLFLQVFILNGFKSWKMEVLILRELWTRFVQVLTSNTLTVCRPEPGLRSKPRFKTEHTEARKAQK